MKQNAKQSRKLRLIGWLMLISALLLSLFIFQWIRAQYREARNRLYEDTQLIFSNVENGILDSLLNKQVASVMQNKAGIDSLHQTDLIRQHNIPATNVVSGKKSIHLYSNQPGISMVHREDTIAPQTIILNASNAPEDKATADKVLRMALQEIMNNLDIDALKIDTDTALLQKQFSLALAERFPGLSIAWTTSTKVRAPFFYQPKDAKPYHTYLALSGYQFYLFKELLPQAAFCLLLLLLTSLAFILAYFNTRRQHLFVQQKDDFISNISHELKTPVATTKIAIEALSRYDAMEDPERSQRYLGMANWEINRLETMINKIMDATQADNGVLVLDKQKINLTELIREITSSLEQVFIQEQISLEWDADTPAAYVMADRTHLTGAIYNLLDNAIKYGNKLIRIELYKNNQNLYLTVSDNGAGIPEAYRSRIFEKFVRVPQENIHNIKGYGLGLSYAKYIIEAHLGSIHLDQKPGWGAVFSICLPEFSSNEI